jgi:TRAP-type mannitol/chloroaromatic compound transport system permease large subunit
MTLPELTKRGYPEAMTIGTLAGAGTLGLLIPPSIIMIVYGVTAKSRSRALHRRRDPGPAARGLFMGYTIVWSLLNPGKIPPPDQVMSLGERSTPPATSSPSWR